MAILNLPQSTVSRHLAYLRNSDLVSERRQEVWMHYRIAEGGTVLHGDLLNLLREDLAGLAQVKDDQKALREYRSRKRAVACG